MSDLDPEIEGPAAVPEIEPERIPREERSEPSDIVSTFALFKDYLDKQLGTLKEDLKEEAQSSTDQAAKKLKESTDISFKYEGNKQQYRFNTELAEHVAVAKKALSRDKLPKVCESLERLDKSIRKRNKLIRLADKSPAGWDLVKEYLSDELASGSDDEKRIKKAEQTALRKRNQNKQRGRVAKTRPQPYAYPSTSTASPRSSTSPQPAFYSAHFTSSRPSGFAPRKAAQTDICFACGLQGHWRADCRKNIQNVHQASGSRGSAGGSAGGNP